MLDRQSDSKASRVSDEAQIGWRMAGIGFQVMSEVAAGALLGWLFDRWRGVPGSYAGVLTGSIIGITVGLWSLIRNALKLNRELDRKHPTAGRGRPIPPTEYEKPDPLWSEQNDDNDWNQPGQGSRS